MTARIHFPALGLEVSADFFNASGSRLDSAINIDRATHLGNRMFYVHLRG
jgi:hypothetical protein